MDNEMEPVWSMTRTADNGAIIRLEKTRKVSAEVAENADAIAAVISDMAQVPPCTCVESAQRELTAAKAARGLDWADLGPSLERLQAQGRCLLRDAMGRARDIADPAELARTAIDLARAVHDLAPAPTRSEDWGQVGLAKA